MGMSTSSCRKEMRFHDGEEPAFAAAANHPRDDSGRRDAVEKGCPEQLDEASKDG